MWFIAQVLLPEQGLEPVPDDLDAIKETIYDTLLGVWQSFVSHLPYLAAGLAALLFTWIVALCVRFGVSKALSEKRVRGSIKRLLVRFSTLVVWGTGLMLAAMIVFPGLTPAKALGAVGLLSVAIGLAFKDIFENFFAGILLLWRFPFENGDFIRCEHLEGVVEDVEVRMTRVRRTTGELLVVPNAFLFKNAVEVVTSRPRRRVHLTTSIAYGEDIKTALEVIEGAVRECETVDLDRPLQIWPKEFGSSSVDIDVAWWTESRPVSVRRSRGEVITAVKSALDDAGIEIPFPYRTLTFKEPLRTAPAKDEEMPSHSREDEE